MNFWKRRDSAAARSAGFWLRAALLCFSALWVNAADHPNILWIVSEDSSVHYLRLYGAKSGETPNIDRLAEEGITFDNAYSCSPVCSVARTTLMTGMYAPQGGFQFHRKIVPAQMPAGLEMWPSYLRRLGYYTSNNAKEDYNVIPRGQPWDDSSRRASWRNRPEGAPFFHMQTITLSHEGSLHFDRETMAREKTQTPPEEVELPPYHPDTPLFRYTHARYFDRMRLVDREVGRLVEMLREDGLLEETFIFYFGDHGGVLPRSKGYLYETGLRVPLVVRVPENWTHLAGQKRGSRDSQFVTFVDFSVTAMNLAASTRTRAGQLPRRAPMAGMSFLAAPNASSMRRRPALGYADRFDEKCDFVRSIRVGPYKYVRNFQAYYPDGLQNNYRYQMLAYQEWRQLYAEGKLNVAQRAFFERRPAEQLFNLESSPYEIHDVANDPRWADVLERMRSALRNQMREMNDLSFYPEPFLIEHAMKDPVAFGSAHAEEIERLMAIADLALPEFPSRSAAIDLRAIRERPGEAGRIAFTEKKGEQLRKALGSKHSLERYWALIALSVLGEAARPMIPDAVRCLDDDDRLVRMRAAEFLGGLKERDPMPVMYDLLNSSESEAELILLFNTVVYLRDVAGWPFDPGRLQLRVKEGEFRRRVEYLSAGRADSE